ncbi:MAG: hypothetical protein JWO62_3000 [Acidimicrobiaceae bacterium]|nr:hypothetical protein [Acidimicrobiaceae bacterium]
MSAMDTLLEMTYQEEHLVTDTDEATPGFSTYEVTAGLHGVGKRSMIPPSGSSQRAEEPMSR